MVVAGLSRPIPPSYKTKNWPTYNEALKRRGSLTVWFDPAMTWVPPPTGMRPIGVGRKNWLFAGSDTGGETLARAMTLIESAKMNGLDPQAYLADLFDRIHDHKVNRLDELLPWRWTPKPTVTSENEAT